MGTGEGTEAGENHQSQGRRKRIRQVARSQAEGKEGAQAVSSSFFSVFEGIYFREGDEEAERLQVKLNPINAINSDATSLVAVQRYQPHSLSCVKIRTEFRFHSSFVLSKKNLNKLRS